MIFKLLELVVVLPTLHRQSGMECFHPCLQERVCKQVRQLTVFPVCKYLFYVFKYDLMTIMHSKIMVASLSSGIGSEQPVFGSVKLAERKFYRKYCRIFSEFSAENSGKLSKMKILFCRIFCSKKVVKLAK